MTNPVTSLTRSVSKEIIKKLFAKFSEVYGNLWSSRAKTDSEWESCAATWYEALQHFDLLILRRAAAESFLQYENYPPTLGQLVSICMKKSGTPSEHDVIDLMIKREFNHPVVKFVYDKVGSWLLTIGKSEHIKARTKEVYAECLMQFRSNQEDSWKILENHNNTKSLPEPEKVPTQQERKGLKERLVEYQQKINEAKLNCKGIPYTEFDEKKIQPGHRDFDKKTYDDYRNYLLSIPAENILILPASYAYDRMRLIAAREQPELLRRAGYNPNPQSDEKEPPRNTTKAYKNWVGE